ncbi:MAG: DNA polymerase III subunit alpha [bacterium]|nr:DNA polymerase III subunit alpha [bacterium]
MFHSDFVSLHNHSEYSLLDGAIGLEELVKKAHDLKMPAIALTDHGNMFGAIEFYKHCLQIGIKPIIGCEVYVAPGSRFEKNTHGFAEASFHLILLTKDITGYKNLLKLVSIGYLEGFYYKPRVDKEALKAYHKGLIALSGCIKGEIPYLVNKNEIEKARKVICEYRELFGEDNFYLELQDNDIREQEIANKNLIEFSKELSVPLVATNDTHYIDKEDAEAHDALLCIQTGKTVSETNRMKFSTQEFYFKNPLQIKKLFSDTPSAIANTVEIAKRCNLELEFGKIYLPQYDVPKGENLNDYLRRLCFEGLNKRYSQISEEIRERLEFELKMIIQLGYAGYFLIVWDLIKFAKENGIVVGPGRGSAAGSLVAYTLGITNVDPIRHKLFFERFLNPERVSMPDIDIDFCDDRREEIINYIAKKYGEDHVAQIITFGTMLAKQVIRDAGRVLGMPYGEVDKIAKLIPTELNITLQDTISRVVDFAAINEGTPQQQKLIKIAMKLEGLVRHASTHAAGVVISKDNLTEYTPLYKDVKGDVITTQYSKDSLESIGLLKMDFLGLKTLTVIKNTLNLVREKQGISINLEEIPTDDKKTYKLLSKADSIGLFQLESSGMRDLLRKLKPEVFEDIIALLALYRPGPLNSGMLDEYIKGKYDKTKIKYPHSCLEEILKETYGVIVYQEQVMQIASELAGFTLGQADELRRAMGKKIPEKMEKMRQLFINGAITINRDVSKAKANEIFELMFKFAEYGFNKSHSTAYALISYQTAYLKTHYPLEFMSALLTSEVSNTDKIGMYISECRRMKIKILPPCVNESDTYFTVAGGNIRFGLSAVKNVGVAAIKSIKKCRKEKGSFASIYNFCKRVDLRLVNKRVLESLIKCGAFDFSAMKRSQLMALVDHAVEIGIKTQQDRISGQASFFSMMENEKQLVDEYSKEILKMPEWNESRLLHYEKEVLGLYVTGHPLAKYEKEIERHTTVNTQTVANKRDNDQVIIGGIINSIKEITTKSNKIMAYLELEDLHGNVEVIVFPSTYEQFRSIIKVDELVLICGKINMEIEGKAKINAVEVILLKEANIKLTSKVHIKFRTPGMRRDNLLSLKKILSDNKGKVPVCLHIITTHHGEVVASVSSELNVTPSNQMIEKVEALFGENMIWVEDKKENLDTKH